MKRTSILFGALVLPLALVCPAFADHGRLSTTVRDPWINLSASDLIDSGLAAAPDKSVDQLTNLEVAQLTAQAAQRFYAQADPSMLPPPLPDNGAAPAPGAPSLLPDTQAVSSKNLGDLVEEFRGELTAMGVDVDKLEDRINDAKTRNEVFAALQNEYLKRTGTDVGGFSRGYMYNYRGFGANAGYAPMDYNADIFMEMDLKSVPVPSLLFDARLRFWRSIGMYYQDPIQPEYQLRWIALSDHSDLGANETFDFTGGDFFKSYTPLTLWNYDAPIYTFVDPTSFRRTRRDTEELVYMDHGPDWHMRGFQASTDLAWPQDPAVSSFHYHAMGGVMQDAGPFTFSSYYAGTQGSIGFLKDNLQFTGTGLLLWNDTNSANVPYDSTDPLTFARTYQVGSVTSRATIPLGDQISVTGSMENAFTQYNDDAQNSQRQLKDWALTADGALNVAGVHLTAKYLNIGPYFYSPGAQTNRYSPAPGSLDYLTTTLNGIDDALPGYLNGSPFQNIAQPYFAPYDRLAENILPYGDATPNREVFILGLSAELGDRGWLKPQASYTASAQEIQPDYVLNSTSTGQIPVDSQTNTTTPRVFGGYEGALTLDMAKAFNLKAQTYDVAFDYKHQTTNLGVAGVSPFTVNTLILAGDFNIPLSAVSSVVWSAAFEQAQSSGSEYFLNATGNPPTLASYSSYLDTATLGSYVFSSMNLTRQIVAFGMMYPLSDKIDFRTDLFLIDYKSADDPAYKNQDQVLRFTYEAHF